MYLFCRDIDQCSHLRMCKVLLFNHNACTKGSMLLSEGVARRCGAQGGACADVCSVAAQDAVSSLQCLEVLEVVGARGLRIEGGLGRLSSLLELEFNACECAPRPLLA